MGGCRTPLFSWPRIPLLMSGARDGSHRPAVRLSGLTEGPVESSLGRQVVWTRPRVGQTLADERLCDPG